MVGCIIFKFFLLSLQHTILHKEKTMLTIETIDYRNQVNKVLEEVSSMLEEKFHQYEAQFDAPYSSSEPTEEEQDAHIEAGYLAVAYSKMQNYVLKQSNKHQLETLRMIQRTIHES